MSFRAVTWAFDQVRGIGANEKLVLVALAEFANDEDETWRAREEIAVRAECALRTVDTHLKNLEQRGLLTRSARYAWCDSDSEACAARGAHKHRTGTLYHLNVGAQPSVLPAPVSTHAKVATVEEPLKTQGNSHTCKTCMCGEASSTVANLRSPQSQVLRTHMISYPPAKPPYLTHPDPNPTQDARNVVDGSGQDHLSPAQPQTGVEHNGERAAVEGLTQREAGLIAACLPAVMHAMDAQGAKRVAALLAERVNAGWHPNHIQRIMGQAPMPERVHRMAGLVASRLKNNVICENAPARLAHANVSTNDLFTRPDEQDVEPLSVDSLYPDEPQRQARVKELLDTNPTMTIEQALRAEVRDRLHRRPEAPSSGAA